jgi:geranylgeranyl diphosphate synthase, type I
VTWPNPASPSNPAPKATLPAIDRYREGIVGELKAVLEPLQGPPYSLMRYHLGWEDREGLAVVSRGGKLLRPALCLLCCEASGGDWRPALPAAAAIELLHNFTLLHDDIEDASTERHGRGTVWSVWDVAEAINAGDGMLALSHATLLRLDERGHPAELVLRAARILDDGTLRLCEGQHRDLVVNRKPHATRNDYLAMIEGKTASLLAASCGIGALLANASDETIAGLQEFGRRLGLAFQIRDDILGIWGIEEETGKPSSDDLRNGKRSYPIVAALERTNEEQREALQALLNRASQYDDALAAARAMLERLGAREESERAAREQAEAAIASIAGLPLEPARRADLEALARFAADRSA